MQIFTIDESQINAIQQGSRTETSGSAGDFLAALQYFFDEPARVMSEFADPNVNKIYLPGLGSFEEDSVGFQLASAVYLTRAEAIYNSLFSYEKFDLVTLPDKTFQLIG